MPTDQQIREYAEKLPPIYRNVMEAFPGVSPHRRIGDGLVSEAIHEYVEEEYPEHSSDDIISAVLKLADRGFLSRTEKIIFNPTPVGERLITAITGRVPNPEGIPELPVPTWG